MKLSLGLTPRDYSVAGGVVYDTDAQAYFTANTAITSSADKNAINTFYLGLKSDGIYTKIKAMYLPIWGSALSSKWNLINNRTFDLSFSTGWTFSSGGALPNGTSAYANTNLIPSTALTLNNAHISYYSRTSTLGSGNRADIGSFYANTMPQYSYMIFQSNGRGSDNNAIGYISMTDPGLRYTQTNAAKFITTTRTANNSIKIIENGVVKSTNTTVQTSEYQGLPQISIYLGAINYRDSLTPQNALLYSQKECAFASIGDGLTDTEVSNFSNRVNILMTYFGINVYNSWLDESSWNDSNNWTD